MDFILDSKFQIPDSKRRGFSMIEIAVVIAIVGIISVVAITTLFSRRSRVELDNATRQVAALLREAQSKSINQEDNVVWGVHFENSTSTTPFYALFKTSYSAANTVARYSLPNLVQFSNISSGGTLDITFTRLSGIPSTSTSIGFNLTTGAEGGTAASVSRDSSGLIFFDDFNRTNL